MIGILLIILIYKCLQNKELINKYIINKDMLKENLVIVKCQNDIFSISIAIFSNHLLGITKAVNFLFNIIFAFAEFQKF